MRLFLWIALTVVPLLVSGNSWNRKSLQTKSLTRPEFVLEIDIIANKASAYAHKEHSISFLALVVNVVADLCPHGMLPLAYGFAKGGPTGIVPAIILVLLFGSMSAYSMTAFSSLSTATGSDTIADIWGRLISPKSQYIVDLAIFALCYGCCVFYSAFVGDIFGALAKAFGFQGIFATRANVLLGITSTFLLPLCLQQDLSALQVSSLLGVFGIFYTLGFHVLRLFDGSYASGAALLEHIVPKLRPHFPNVPFTLLKINKGTLTLANMLCVAFLAHYNSINYFKELNKGQAKYVAAIATGFGISTCVFITMMLVGYKIFGTSALPLILNNFPKTADPLASGARLATGVAITFAYPLMFAGLKSAMFSLMDGKPAVTNATPVVKGKVPAAVVTSKKSSELTKNMAIVAVVASITSIAVKCGEEDVSVVLGIVGSVLGCFVAYVLPGWLQLTHFRQRNRAGLKNNKLEVIVNHALVAIGAIFGVLGVWVTLEEAAAGGHGGH